MPQIKFLSNKVDCWWAHMSPSYEFMLLILS